MYYFREKLRLNTEEYNKFMRLKFGLEAADMRAAGIKKLSYRDMIHYRTFVGDTYLIRYATLRAIINE